MSQRETLIRYSTIIKKLRSGPANLKEIQLHLEKESDLQGYDLNTSARTFQRDLDDLRSVFQIDIRYDFSGKKYTK
jgi:predicted DNA-binding transcriptional regulator YafY